MITTERWKQKAITDIQLLEVREQAAEGIRLQIQELERDIISVGGIDTRKAPIKGGGNAQERRLAVYLDRKAKLEQKEEEYTELVKHTRKVLENLPLQEQAVLIAFYCSHQRRGDAVRGLEYQMYVSRATIYRLRDKGLVSFAYRMGYL